MLFLLPQNRLNTTKRKFKYEASPNPGTILTSFKKIRVCMHFRQKMSLVNFAGPRKVSQCSVLND